MRAGVVGLALLGVLAGCGSDSPAGMARATDGSADGRDAAVEQTAEARDAADASDRQASEAGADGATDLATDLVDASDAPTGDGADGVTPGDALDVSGDRTDTAIEAGSEVGVDAMDGSVEQVSMPCVAAGACDPFLATSCGAQVCAIGLDGNTMCIAASATPKGLGVACTTRNECAGGLDCVAIGSDATTTCQRMCPRGSIGFCGGEYRCTDFIGGCIQYCRLRDLPCDIYAQNCADTGKTCGLSIDSETGARYTGCRPAGPLVRGDRCDQGVCGKGLLCVREGGVSTCRQICTGAAGALPCLSATETCSGLTGTYQITYCK